LSVNLTLNSATILSN